MPPAGVGVFCSLLVWHVLPPASLLQLEELPGPFLIDNMQDQVTHPAHLHPQIAHGVFFINKKN